MSYVVAEQDSTWFVDSQELLKRGGSLRAGGHILLGLPEVLAIQIIYVSVAISIEFLSQAMPTENALGKGAIASRLHWLQLTGVNS